MTSALLRVDDVRKYFPTDDGVLRSRTLLRAVDGVSFQVAPGETVGLVGESGCGKSSLAKVIVGALKTTSGRVYYGDVDVGALSHRQLQKLRRELQYSYQDIGASLDPRWKVRRILHEPLLIHMDASRQAREENACRILDAVGLPRDFLELYPHELSGGQQRRVGLARLLMLSPKMLILDEPTSGLDVSVRATFLTLLADLQQQFRLTYLLISHDLSVVRGMSDRVLVMYLGKIVESGPTDDVFESALHPYTRSLLASVPTIGGARLSDQFVLQGEPPDPTDLPSGCRFRTRCPLAEARCAAEEPPLAEKRSGHGVACHFA